MIANIRKYRQLYIPVIMGFGLIISACCHRLMIDEVESYRNSFLIGVEFVFLICSFIGTIVVAIAAFISLVKRKWQSLFHSMVSIIITYLLIVAGMLLDAPTLIYMT